MVGTIKVIRFDFKGKESTIGELWFNNTLFGYTLEDIDRGLVSNMDLGTINKIKVDGKTAIPTGAYKIILNMSNRFKKRMPLLIDVPGFKGVRIHSGNFAKDTEGCILVGSSHGIDLIKNSRATWAKLMVELEKCELVNIIISRR